MSKTPKGPPDWYRLDNAGVLYSALQREKYSRSTAFLLSCPSRWTPLSSSGQWTEPCPGSPVSASG